VQPPRLRTAVLTAITVVIVITCIRLGFWQLDRLHGREAANVAIAAAEASPPRPLPAMLAATNDPTSLRFRPTVATGTYDPAHEVLLYGRSSIEGEPGDQVLTPLRLPDGTGLVVDRGWIPIDQGVPVTGDAAAPTGTVTVAGVLFPPDALTVPTGAASPVERITKVDLGQIGAQLPYPIAPIYLLLQTQRPPQQGSLPEPPPLPPLTNGPHLSYAFQWFSFATIAIVGCIVLLRRVPPPEMAGGAAPPAAKSRRSRLPEERRSEMGCLFAILALITPRFVVFVMWIFTDYLATAYGSWFWPTLGFFVAPTTTLAYAVARNDLSTVTGSITAAGTLVIVIGVLIDIGLIGGGARGRRT
jgi:surfeit locus 1 family protein